MAQKKTNFFKFSGRFCVSKIIYFNLPLLFDDMLDMNHFPVK